MGANDGSTPHDVMHPAAEVFKLVDVVTLASGFASLVVVAISLIIVGFIYYRVREDVKLMEELNTRTAALEKRISEGDYISDQTTNVLYDLYRLFSGVKGFIELRDLGYDVNRQLFDEMERD